MRLSAIRAGTSATYAGSGSLWKTGAIVAHECACVALISMRAVGTPVAFDAIALADSQISRGIMHASTMHRMISVVPSCSATLRACIGSVTVLLKFPLRLPLMGEGNFVGVISWANA